MPDDTQKAVIPVLAWVFAISSKLKVFEKLQLPIRPMQFPCIIWTGSIQKAVTSEPANKVSKTKRWKIYNNSVVSAEASKKETSVGAWRYPKSRNSCSGLSFPYIIWTESIRKATTSDLANAVSLYHLNRKYSKSCNFRTGQQGVKDKTLENLQQSSGLCRSQQERNKRRCLTIPKKP